MGGTKKRTLASMEKSQNDEAEDDTKKKSEKKGPSERKRVDVLPPKMTDQEFMKSLAPLKAITLFNASKTLAVNASVARSILASLESKGAITKVGGSSGHYVWAPAS